MGLQDRDYHRNNDDHYRGSPVGMSMVKILIIVNAVVALLDGIMLESLRAHPFAPLLWGYFSFDKAFADFQIWRVLTYQFLHGGLLHLVFNMIGLHIFGPMMESYWGRRRFLAFYLLSGVAGAVVMSVLSFIPGLMPAGPASPLIGASGAIFGIMAGTATLYPNMVVHLLIPPMPLRMKTLVGVYFGIIIFSLLVGSSNAGGEACHLGGALVGLLLVRHPRWLAIFQEGFQSPIKFRVHGAGKPPTMFKAESPTPTRADIDRILDKISVQGIHSLTEAEKQSLEAVREGRLKNEP